MVQATGAAQKILTATNRFGFGAGPPTGFDGSTSGSSPIIDLPSAGSALQARKAKIAAQQEAYARALQLIETMRADRGEGLTFKEALDAVGRPRQLFEWYADEIDARLALARSAEPATTERLVWFWSNHLAISIRTGIALVLAGPYEREAIRPHVAGRFADMLDAAARHSAMLDYLDGRRSTGPRSELGRRHAHLGLNENFAREILELHTLGVDGGYTQADVISLAEMLTGWDFRRADHEDAGAFVFDERRHEPGAKPLFGKVYPDVGPEQGRLALADLARHPSTARHLAFKLARHFVADQPPVSLVKKLETTFLETDGDLDAVGRTLLEAPEARDASPAKLRLPQEFLVAMLRATGIWIEPRAAAGLLRAMGQPLWQPPSPAGFPDTVAHWLSPEGMKRRLDVASVIARKADPTLDPEAVLEVTMGAMASDETRLAVARAESRQQAMALLFMSPEFQWR